MNTKSNGTKMKDYLKYAEEKIINTTDKDILEHYLKKIEYVCIQYGKYLEGGDKMDKEIFNKAIQNYIADPEKRIPKLMEYAEPLRVKKTAKDLIGVWL